MPNIVFGGQLFVEKEDFMRIGVLTGGGDAVGLNAAIAGLVRGLSDPRNEINVEVIGILNGWQGLVSDSLTLDSPLATELEVETVRGITSLGGTILHTSRENPLKDEAKMAAVILNIKQLMLRGLVAMGGDDTLSVAAELSKRGQNVIGVPKTMDLDLSGTQYSVGFWSYVESVVEVLVTKICWAKSRLLFFSPTTLAFSPFCKSENAKVFPKPSLMTVCGVTLKVICSTVI